MGSKNFTIFLNIVGSGYKLGRCIPHPSVQHFRKLKRCANSNNYHISAQKLKEIQKHINEGKKESQKELLSVSLKDKSLEDKKEVSNDIGKISDQKLKEIQKQINEGKKESQKELLSIPLKDKSLEDKKEVSNGIGQIESLKISGTGGIATDTSNQSNTGNISLPSKPEEESRGSVQEDVSKTIGKLQGEKIYEENQTKPAIGLRNEKEKGRKLNMIDSIRREMKGSYSSLRKKQLQETPSISNLFESRALSGAKDKTDTIKDMNAKVFNTLDSIVSNRVESEQTEKNDKQFKENIPKVTQIVEEEKTDIIKDMNTRAFDTFDSIVVSKRVESQQTEKSDNLFKENSLQKTQIVEEGSIDKEEVGKKTKEKENKDLLKKDLFNKENIFLPQKKNVKSVGEKQIDKAEENILKEKSKISKETVVLRSESIPKTNLNVSVNEVDRPFTQKYMLNTLLDPIAKSSQKKVENRGLSSQSGEHLNEIKRSADRKPQKIDEKVPEQKQKIDESIKPGMGNTKMETSNSTRLLLNENTEDNSKEKIVHRSDIISNQQVEQKNKVMPKMIDHQSSISGEEMNKKEASTDLLEENIVKLSNKIKDQELERIMKQKVAQKNQEKPEIDDKLSKSRKEDNKIKASTNSLKGALESGSNEIKIEKSDDKLDKKIIGQSRSVGKLNSSNMGKLKTQSSKTSPGKGRAKPKPKSTLKVKYRLKETLNHKLQKNEKTENMKKPIADEKRAVAHKKVDQQKPVRKEIKLDKESAVVHEKFDLQQNPVRKEINIHNESVAAHEKGEKQKPVKKEIQLHKEHHSALTKQEFPKIASQVAATVENLQSIEKTLDKIAVKQDFNERGILPFDSSYIMKQLAKSRQSESILEIPGPRIMRVCSNIVNALPVIGTLTISSLMRSYNRLCLSYGDKKFVSNRMSKPLESLFNKHGDIVCLNIPLCGNVILVDKPELIHEVYRQRDMSQMTNSSFDSLNEVYNVLGKKNMRMDAISSVDDHMTCVIEHFDLKNLFWSANRYHDSLEKISDLLVQRITFTRDMHNEVPEDFIKELTKWSLECMMQVLFATEIGSLRSTSYLGHQETDRVLKSLTDATDALRNCESGIQLWRVYETSSFTKLAESINNLERFLCKHIPLLRHDTKLEQRLEMLQTNLESKQNASSLISGLILSGYVDVDKLLKICMETMLIAVNTTSTSLGFVLYHLARNQEKQKVLHKELISVLPDKTSKLNPEVLQELTYLNACVQETLRLKHPIPYSIMRLQRSIVLHKYYIPAGTWVMTANEVACLREENFEDAQLFKPERWLKCSPELYQDTISPLLEAQFEPFLGRDWLQKQLLVGTAKIIRNFNVRYRYGEIGKEGEFLSKPTKPFQFEFLEQHV